jgi:hypothetical protein
MSDPFAGEPYPEFFQALAYIAYPDEPRRALEAHSGWAAPREYPPLYSEEGWAPEIGKAFGILFAWLEDGAVRAWLRTGRDEFKKFEKIDPSAWRRGRQAGTAQTRPPLTRTPGSGFTMVLGPRLLSDFLAPDIPERDLFVVLLVNELDLHNVVVSRDDLMLARPGGLPDSLAGRAAAASLELWRTRPRMSVDRMRGELENHRSDLKPLGKRTVEEALTLLAGRYPGWARNRKPQRSAPRV